VKFFSQTKEMQSALNASDIDLGLQRLQAILLEEQRLLGLSPTSQCTLPNEGALAVQLNSALSKIGELEGSVAQAELMKKASMNALRESQMEVRRLQQEHQALTLQANGNADMRTLIAELQSKNELLNSALEQSQHAKDSLQDSLADKHAELQSALSRCHELEAASSFVAQAEVSRLTLQLRMQEELKSEESKRLNGLLASSEQSLTLVKGQLDHALRSNILSITESRTRNVRKCDEYLQTIDELQRTIEQNSAASSVASERDRLRAAYQEAIDHASALNIKVSQLQHANAQLKLQLDVLLRDPSSTASSATSHTQVSADRTRALSVEILALKKELADARSRAVAVEHQNSNTTPAFFITEHQYSLLVEENAHLMQTNAQLVNQVETLKQQLQLSMRSRQMREHSADKLSNFTLDALCDFCVTLGQRLDGIERSVMQHLPREQWRLVDDARGPG
jgi:hypothetical protein